MESSLEKELRRIRERLDSIEDALVEYMSDAEKNARTKALRKHKEGKTITFIRKNRKLMRKADNIPDSMFGAHPNMKPFTSRDETKFHEL